MSQDNREKENQGTPISIDYEHIDVASIMDQIKKKIAQQPKKMFEDIPPAGPGPSSTPPPAWPTGESLAPGFKGKIKRILLKLMRPFTPLIKFLILPVNEELRETVLILDQTNRRLDFLCATVDRDLRQLNNALNQRIDQICDHFRNRVDSAFDEIETLEEYTKLLHNLSHNLVVELTKLKIEEDTLKGRARILEKDFEFLGKREKALEKKVFK